ncbi:sigma-70 family RNA polymerase sigma factor [Hungatella hathewayi]|uniref:sigma-70 family RNA polymerase sigma factor n=1 Tax=Hungatella hathewayi TaxID=154046 RepID=UPI0035676773
MGERDYLKEQTNEELLRLYQKERKLEIKQELTMRYLYLVKAIAVQMRNVYAGCLQMEDIINEGVIAIMKGIDRYNPENDIKFETFISQRIRGMIIDLVRKNDWLPRDFRKQNKAIEEAKLSLASTMGRGPTDEEIAGVLHMNVKKCRTIQRMSTMLNVLSLDLVMSDEDEYQSVQCSSRDENLQPEAAYLKGEAKRQLVEAIKDLKEKERLVISLYYVEEMNMAQIAQVLQVSEPRISQIHSTAIQKLKNCMEMNL